MSIKRDGSFAGGMVCHDSDRIDRNGTCIKKGCGSHRITFADSVTQDSDKLTDIVYVESYKKHNYDLTYGDRGGIH
jgi:hypothetical protein